MYHLFMNHKKGEQFYDTLLMIDVIGIWITQSIGAAATITTSVLLYNYNLQVALITAYVFLSLRALRDVLSANSVWTRILGFSYLFILRLLAFGLRIYAIESGAASVSIDYFNLIFVLKCVPNHTTIKTDSYGTIRTPTLFSFWDLSYNTSSMLNFFSFFPTSILFQFQLVPFLIFFFFMDFL